jgi:hypothetical protein
VQYLFRLRFELYISTAEYERFSAQLHSRTQSSSATVSPPLIWPMISTGRSITHTAATSAACSFQISQATSAEAAEESDLSRVSTPTAGTEAGPLLPHRSDKHHQRHGCCDHQEAGGYGPQYHRRLSAACVDEPAWWDATQSTLHGKAASLHIAQPQSGSQWTVFCEPTARGPAPPGPTPQVQLPIFVQRDLASQLEDRAVYRYPV